MDSNIITAVILLLFIMYVFIENKNLEIKYYQIHSKRIPNAFNGVRFVILADLHNNKFGKDNEKLIDKISKINPDYILVAGDMVVSSEPDNLEAPYHLLSVLIGKYPIYYSLGNHEQRLVPEVTLHYKSYAKYKINLQELGVQFLENEQVTISRNDENIAITGLVIGMDYFNKLKQPGMTTEYIQNLVGIPQNKCYNILIAHNPVYFNFYAEWGADLIVSGHVHGGIIRLPGLGGIISPQYKFMPKYDAGKFEMNDKIMLVSKGLGLHTIKLRIHNRPELMVVTLNNGYSK
ncbi:MAG: metallophosphoesterase [Anaerocolumna sp.]